MKRRTLGLAIALSTVGACSSPERPNDAGLPILQEYPGSVNATAARGTLQLERDGCLVFTREDGSKLLPIFRSGTTLGSLESRFGSLGTARPVTVMGMTVLKELPADAADFAADHGCTQTPFVFGNFGNPGDLPPAPPTLPGG